MSGSIEKLDENINRMKLLYTLLEDMGNLIQHLGEKENEVNETEFLKSFSTNSISILNELSDSLNAEELGKLMKLLIKLSQHGSNLTNFLELSSNDKIVVGKDIKKLADETNLLISILEKRGSSE